MTFDLEKARATYSAGCAEDAANLVPDLIAGIERLRADNACLSKAVISIQEERDLAQAEFRAYHKAWEEQAIEIERLRAIIDTPPEESEWISDLKVIDRSAGSGLIDIEIAKKWHTAYRKAQNSNLLRKQEIERMREEMENYGDDYVCQMKSKDARIAELEDALAEERAQRYSLENTGTQLSQAGNQFQKRCLRSARNQLQIGGKIGPDASESHLRPYEVVAADLAGMMAKSWQITDERKAALEHILICHHCRYDDSGCKAPDVLRAMLEAGQ